MVGQYFQGGTKKFQQYRNNEILHPWIKILEQKFLSTRMSKLSGKTLKYVAFYTRV